MSCHDKKFVLCPMRCGVIEKINLLEKSASKKCLQWRAITQSFAMLLWYLFRIFLIFAAFAGHVILDYTFVHDSCVSLLRIAFLLAVSEFYFLEFLYNHVSDDSI